MPYSSAVLAASVPTRQSAMSLSSSKTPQTTLELPISIARSRIRSITLMEVPLEMPVNASVLHRRPVFRAALHPICAGTRRHRRQSFLQYPPIDFR